MFLILSSEQITQNYRYINADLKIPLHVCIHIKTIPRKFRILNRRILELFAREVRKFPKKLADFYHICHIYHILSYLFLNVCKQTFHISHVHISQRVKGALM